MNLTENMNTNCPRLTNDIIKVEIVSEKHVSTFSDVAVNIEAVENVSITLDEKHSFTGESSSSKQKTVNDTFLSAGWVVKSNELTQTYTASGHFTKKPNFYPSNVSLEKVHEKIANFNNCLVFAGPNCWGTALHILNLIPTLRYVSDIEFTEFVSEAKIISFEPGENIKDGTVISIWNNIYNSVQHNHVALAIDGINNLFFEKQGPDEGSPFRYISLEKILLSAETKKYDKVHIVNHFDQSKKGIYAMLIDFSDITSKSTSNLEEKIALYHANGIFLDKESLKTILEGYKVEIKDVKNARDLSLTEGLYHLLRSMINKINKIQENFLITKDRSLARLLSSHSELRAIVDSEIDYLAAQIHSYRRSIIYPDTHSQKNSIIYDQSIVLL